MCKQTHHHFLVGQEKQHSNGIVNNEYRINLIQFRTIIHISFFYLLEHLKPR